jgi:arylsulfatase A-like enzyme
MLQFLTAPQVDFITDRSSFISNSSLKDAPWFLKVSFHRPHSPYDPPQRLIDKQPLSSLRPVYTCAKGDPLGWDAVFAINEHGCGPKGKDAWCGDMPATDSAFSRRCYQANVAFVDEWVGKIFDALTATSQLDRTYMLYTSDHGDGQSDHFHWRKGFPFEFASHVPFMMRWPENAEAMGNLQASNWKRGVTIAHAVVELRDIFPVQCT